MILHIIVVAIGIQASLAIIGRNHFDGYKVYKLKPKSRAALDIVLSELNTDENEMDVFKKSRFRGDTTDILISAEKADHLENIARRHKVPIKRAKSNFGRSLEVGQNNTRRASKDPSDPFRYRSYAEMKDFIYNISRTYYKCVKVVKIGKTYENRDMFMVKISKDISEDRPIILVDALIHAREWVSGAMALYLVQKMAEHCKIGSELSNVDWYIIPMVNPDGYEFSRSEKQNRLWRKTRSVPGSSRCVGVDGNRNYDWHFGESGVSKSKCADDYPGPKGFSEVETTNVATVMDRNQKNIKLYLSLHSYGEYLVYPYGYTGNSLPRQWRKLRSLAMKVRDGIVGAGGNEFTVESAGQWYPAAGASDDYAFGAMNIPYSFTMELTYGYGFLFPEEELKDYLETVFNGIKVLPQEIAKEFSAPKTKFRISDFLF